MKNKLIKLATLTGVLLLTACHCKAATLSVGTFEIFEGSDPENLVDISWTLNSTDTGYEFCIDNEGFDGVVASVYFEETTGSIVNLSEVNVSGISFGQDSRPKNFAGGNNIGFTSDITFGADSPAPHNGININEEFCFTFDSFDTARVGIHVQSIGESDLSASYIAKSNGVGVVSIVPEPTTTSLLGLAGLALILRKRR